MFLTRAPMDDHNIISISGGKDSTALLLLALERQPENLQAVFADTGHEHQQTYEYVRYLEQVTGVPIRWVRADFAADIARKREFVSVKWREHGVSEDKVLAALAVLQPTGNPFLDLCIWKGRFPSTKARFCSEELKHIPIMEQVQRPILEAGADVISWQGVRADESLARRHLAENEAKRTFPNGATLWNYRPLLTWSAEDCFTMHRKHGIKHNPLYEQGMGRVGCMPCIHARKDELLEISKRFPEAIARVSEWEQVVSDAAKQGVSTFFHFEYDEQNKRRSRDVALRESGIFSVVEWSKTSRGGRQYDLMRTDPDAPLCSSIYGLCE
jgi:3'-phosphoadenosine 5'-phosphosulfate sulfotransferase (PAPS reductase)/FAD synthetase